MTNTRKLCGIAILAALAVTSVYIIHFPIFAAVPFLEYDVADVFVFIGVFMYGPWFGLFLTAVACVVQGVTVSASGGIYGIIMHFLSSGSFAVVSGLIYNKNRTIKGAVVALCSGIVAWTLIMIPANYVVTPLFLGMPTSEINVLIGYIILFNFIKSTANSFLTFLLYKRVKFLFEKLELSKGKVHVVALADGESLTFNTSSEQETKDVARALAKNLVGTETVLLNGDLGAGKTVFTKGIASQLGVEDEIVSPTFNIVRQYNGIYPLFHFDMYRLSEDEISETGVSEHLGNGVCVIEWNKFSTLFGTVYTVDIERTGNDSRKITITKKIIPDNER